MRRVIREELQHIVSEEPRHFDCFSRQFRNHRNFSCFDCSRNGHTQCYCTANTNSKRHYVSHDHGEGTDQPLVINESCYRNTIQGNGLAPLHVSLRDRPVMGARRQTLAHKQRLPTSQGGTDKYVFCAPYDGHFVDNKQSHCRPVVRSSSQSENTAHVSREEFAGDVSNSNNLCDRVDQVENALNKMDSH